MWRAKPYAGQTASSARMSASRWTLATIDAAAIEATKLSPLGYALCGSVSSGISRPSTSTKPGTVDVEPVDLGGLDHAEPDGHGAAANLGVEPLARRGGEHLRVRQPLDHG